MPSDVGEGKVRVPEENPQKGRWWFSWYSDDQEPLLVFGLYA